MYSTLNGLVSFVRYNFPDQACQKNMLHSDLIIFFFKFSNPSKDSWKHLNACQNAKWKCIIQLKIMLCVTANPIHHIMLFFICHTLLFRSAYIHIEYLSHIAFYLVYRFSAVVCLLNVI